MRATKCSSHMLAAAITVAAVIALVIKLQPGTNANLAEAEPAKADKLLAWPMLGCTPQRNMINTLEKNVPVIWAPERRDRDGNILEKALNIKWVAALGSRSYGGPVISGGKVFVGTNNHAPRDPNIVGDKGILM